jgi:hypothetical protein
MKGQVVGLILEERRQTKNNKEEGNASHATKKVTISIEKNKIIIGSTTYNRYKEINKGKAQLKYKSTEKGGETRR